jgi:hypothetical protein
VIMELCRNVSFLCKVIARFVMSVNVTLSVCLYYEFSVIASEKK